MNKENKEPHVATKIKRAQSMPTYNLREIQSNYQSFDGKSAKRFLPNRDVGILTNGMHVNCLPIEILSMIFGYMKPSELAKSVLPVCKHWNAIGNGPLFWRSLTFGTQGTTADLLKVVAKSTLLRRVEIHNRNDFGSILKAIYFNCRQCDIKVEEITLKMCTLSSRKSHSYFSTDCTQLRLCCKSPNCTPAAARGGVVNTPHSTNMMIVFPNLKKLTLINMIIRSKKFFNNIGAVLRSLSTLTIVGCHHFSSANLQLIAENCTQLTHVTILHNVLNGRGVDIDTKHSWDLAYRDVLQKRGGLLQVLEIDVEFVLDYTLAALSASTRLHTLSLENACNLSVDGITAISTLRYLDNLHIHNCLGLDDETVVQLFVSGNLCLLETLTMTRCSRITDLCLEVVASSCPRINKINVSYCPQITDGGVEVLFQKCIKLRYLNLLCTSGIHGSSFQLIPQRTPNLRLLIIEEYCDKIKEKCMKDLIARFPGLLIRRWKRVY